MRCTTHRRMITPASRLIWTKNVQFDSQRIGNPHRIFFDLKNTRLSSELTGKSFDVDDGLVKKIRVAQYKPNRARVVIETDDRAGYKASLLMNPPRLIIDVRERKCRHGDNRTLSAAVDWRRLHCTARTVGRSRGARVAARQIVRMPARRVPVGSEKVPAAESAHRGGKESHRRSRRTRFRRQPRSCAIEGKRKVREVRFRQSIPPQPTQRPR